ncbi:MAG: pro-sigmaK processing inhibitor BofA family protein [Oscillospiraceae bacterium]|nr:pro-sigmaK processing inhibitor BofA family protein [Oscillospiraceae bacterium]
METLNTVLLLALAVIVVIVLVRIISAPIKLIFKLLINTAIGFGILFLINLIGQNFGFTLEMNLLHALIVGIFGIPGVVVLILLQFLL